MTGNIKVILWNYFGGYKKKLTCKDCKHCDLTAYEFDSFWCDIVTKFYITKDDICEDFESRKKVE